MGEAEQAGTSQDYGRGWGGLELTVWWQLFPHQGFSSSSRCTSWAQRTADMLSARQNMREMAQRHRLELCRVQGHSI